MQEDRVDVLLCQWRKERGDLDVSPMEIIGRVFRLGRLIDQALKPIIEKADLTVPEFDILAVLRRSGEPFRLPVWKLREFSLLSSGAMTNRLDRVESKGLVERIPNPEDRRGVLVELTSKGNDAIENILPERIDQAKKQVSSLSSSERKQLAGLLRKLLAGMESHDSK
jgi:DNA-binding MarR family transcriptional regulator